MVLVFSLQRPPPEEGGEANGKKELKNEGSYVWSTFEDRIAVLYNDRKGEMPSADEIDRLLCELQCPVAPRFFATPFDGVLNEIEEHESPMFKSMFEDITKRVHRRENVTVVHRGVNTGAHLERVLVSFFQAVRIPAEYGMQVVADEIAKERQMQRLLQMNTIPGDAETTETRGAKDLWANAARESEGGVKLSKALREKIRKLRQEYHYVHPSDKQTAASSRYGLISAAHDEILIPPHTDSPSLRTQNFGAFSPSAFHSRSSRATSLMAVRNTRSHAVLYSLIQRRNTALLLSELRKEESVSGCDPLPGNGWGGTMSVHIFDGVSSVMALPGVPNFEELIRDMALDFWIRTDLKPEEGKRVLIQIMEGQRDEVGQLFQLSLNWYEDMPDSLRIVIRDSANRVLEAVASVAKVGLTDGTRFHHVMIRVQNLEEGQLMCEVDGLWVDVQLIQQEHPVAFNTWSHRLFIGGYLDEVNSPALVFRGVIAELRFSSGGFPLKPVVRWPLIAIEGGALQEMTRTIPPDHHETLLNLRVLEEPAPRCAPSFDGNLVINVGTLPLLGQLMHHWRIEVCFRTDVTSRMMSLVGVTDRNFKMQEFGIVLNAEPVITKERLRYHELHVTLYIVDAFGCCCSAILRGNERENLMDGEWHKLVWRCVDSEVNNFTVKVDDVLKDVLFVSREGPTRFVSYDNWIAVGGHNVRNWKVLRPFTGQIDHFYVSLSGCPYVTLDMNEGPGAYVLQDNSRHNNHGLLINAETDVVRRNDVVWIPGPEDKVDEINQATRPEMQVFKKNNVSVAVVIFTCYFSEGGVVRESLYDVLSGKYHEIAHTPHILPEHTQEQWKSWYGLPTQCYQELDTVTRLEESINTALSVHGPQGHLMVTVRIGDCYATVLHVSEAELPPDAMYDCNMLKWHYPYMVEGTQGWRELMLNRMIEGAESVLLIDSLKPYVTAKLGPLNSGSRSVISEDIIRSLKNSGRPWFLPAVLHTHLINAEFGSTVHLIQRVRPRMSVNEAAAVGLFSKRLFDRVRENASLLIQRNWRICLAKGVAAVKREQRSLNDRKVEEIRSLRLLPAVKMKVPLGALLITLHNTECPGVPPIENDVESLEEALRHQGYDVTTLKDPNKETILRAISQMDTSKTNFIYISGYGGALNLRQPPLFEFESLSIDIAEQAQRTRYECDESASYRELIAQMRAERATVPAPKSKKKKAAAPRRPNKQAIMEAELRQRQLEMAFLADCEQMDDAEAAARDTLVREYDKLCQRISREMHDAVVATWAYEEKYRATSPEGDTQNFVYLCNSQRIEPFPTTVINVNEIIATALHQGDPPLGLQCVVAVDLQPVTSYASGLACLASSTGNKLWVPYRPFQREFLSWTLVKAFNGHLPKVSTTSKYALLSGGIETAENHRDWKSLAWYVLRKLEVCCSPERFNALRGELERHIPFVGELVPVREIFLDSEAKDRRRRERESLKVKAQVTFGVGSAKIQSDMFSFFREFLEGVTVTELIFTNKICILFAQNNKGIDGILVSDVADAVEKCRPLACTLAFEVEVTAAGVEVQFKVIDAADRLPLGQWLTAISMRSLSWQFPQRPAFGLARLDVDYVEYLYNLKVMCSGRRYRQVYKQMITSPVPKPYVRFVGARVLQ